LIIREKLTDKIEIPNYFNYIYFQALEQTDPKRVNVCFGAKAFSLLSAIVDKKQRK